MEELKTLDGALVDGESRLVHASNGKRFGNYLIDSIVFTVIIFVLMFGLISSGEDAWLMENSMIVNVSYYLLMFLYYVICESMLGGKTLGKMITKTRTVDLNGRQPEAGAIFLRTLSRFVPFEAFSFFGEKPGGWHDRWTKTMVIDESKS